VSAQRTTPRRTQKERSEATRKRILDAAIHCLAEDGYACATTTRIVDRAGVSRGAQLHHFPSKAILLTEAIRHLASERISELERAAKRPHSDGWRTESALDLLWSTFSGQLFQAALELWVAARSDSELRKALIPVERDIGRRAVETARSFFDPAIAARPDLETLLLVALDTMRGIAAVHSYEPSAARKQRHWKRARAALVPLFEPVPKG
jgi:AcrR family transcriptional regulator